VTLGDRTPPQPGAELTVLRDLWHARIPLSAAMELEPLHFADHALELRAPLHPNRNVHETGFAGSLYAAAVLCGWGLVHLELASAGLPGTVVVARAGIEYRRPVTGDFRCRCEVSGPVLEAALDALREEGRCRLELTVEVVVEGDEGGSAARLTGSYAVRGTA
jgi:thioesterase domain-containing protein